MFRERFLLSIIVLLRYRCFYITQIVMSPQDVEADTWVCPYG